MPYIITLEQVAETLQPANEGEWRNLVGGKAAHLAALKNAGFKVPKSFVITTTAFDMVMDHVLAQDAALLNPQLSIERFDIPQELTELLAAFYHANLNFPLAIRSSSTDEDTSARSLAGMQHSLLNVRGFEGFMAALKLTWQSFYAHQRLLYPIQLPPDCDVPRMAVIAQAYIPASAAGVVFTQNPMRAHSDSLLINVNKGTGEGVVGGDNVQSYVLSRAHTPDEGDAPNGKILSLQQLQALWRTALDVEAHFGQPQDIEFCFLSDALTLIQTRPIAKGAAHGNARQLYSNVNVGEALDAAATPLTWSLGMDFAKEGFTTLFHSAGLSYPVDYQFVTTFHGRIYLNISEVLSVFTQYPFLEQQELAKIAGMYEMDTTTFDVKPLSHAALWKSIPKASAQYMHTQYRVLTKLKAWARRFQKEKARLLAVDLASLSHEALRAHHGALHALFQHTGEAMLTAASNFLLSHQAVMRLLATRKHDERSALEADLFSGLKNVKSASPGIALMRIARLLETHTKGAQAFMEASLETVEEAQAFLRAFCEANAGSAPCLAITQFFENYGLRTTQEAELLTARWSEDPRFVLKVIQAHLRQPQTRKPEHIQKHAATQRKERTKRVSQTLWFNAVFKPALLWAQNNARLREEWRAYVVDTLGLYRFFTLECGRRLKEVKALKETDDVFFLTYAEIMDWLKEGTPHADIMRHAAFRRARHMALLAAPRMPDSFVSHGQAVPAHAPDNELGQLRGMPASSGVVKARARVLHSPEEGSEQLAYGEVIVAQSTDVGWTPLFLMASALLTERGGPLSHSCVVAREYALPSIVAIPHLLQRVKTGDWLYIDADKGTVSILEDAEGDALH